MAVAELTIVEFSKEGHGIGYWTRPEGQTITIEVPFTMPGDQVRVLLLKRRKGLYQSRLLELLQPSPQRVQPRCIHFGSCGGCRWQEVPYEQQLKVKEASIRQKLKAYDHPQVIWHPILACDPPWYYRNKMELTFSSDKAGHRYLGLILYGTRGHVFNMQECHLAQPWFVQAVKAVEQWWADSGLEAYHSGYDTGSLRSLTLRGSERTGDRLAMLTVSGNSLYALSRTQLNAFVSSLQQAVMPASAEATLSVVLRIQQIAKGHPTNFYEMILAGPDHIREVLHLSPSHSLQFRISPTAFFQPNTRQAEHLYSRALEMAKLSQTDVVYDLYCGTGTLGMCAARLAKEVIGVELSPEAVIDARENIRINQLSNIQIEQGDVGHVLKDLLDKRASHPDVVMVDPPRAGLEPRALKHLLACQAPRIVYLSCNPSTQASNLEVLIREGGYRLCEVQPVDQFPQTPHVENIILLTKDRSCLV